jgi:hypothetical protein
MEKFEQYVRELEALAGAALAGARADLESVDFTGILNGDAGAELRRRVSLDDRQSMGAFFTGSELRAKAVDPTIGGTTRIGVWDPACGAGDLLLRYTDRLPANTSLTRTVDGWGKWIYGSDLEPLFVRAARARLVLAAFVRGARNGNRARRSLSEVFPQLWVQDSLGANANTPSVPLVVVNPPYVRIPAEPNSVWARGKVSAAAVFIENVLRRSVTGTRVVGILPDVLRTGSRYHRWRELVARLSRLNRIEVHGAFDPQADVDVFVLDLTVRAVGQTAPAKDVHAVWDGLALESETLGGHFHVSVGSVVPHRDPENGDPHPYLHTRNAPAWGVVTQVAEVRSFRRRLVTPPFVAIRRTSSPSDKWRAVATIVNSEAPVMVENHLIILEPRDRALEKCIRVVEALRSPEVHAWLNQRIRCRHLTVGAIKEIPVRLG